VRSGAGFREVVIKPHVDERLGHVHAEYDSVYGTVMTDWTRSPDGGLELRVQLPANTSAKVYLPGKASNTVMQNGQALKPEYDGAAFVTSVGSGSYRFTVR